MFCCEEDHVFMWLLIPDEDFYWSLKALRLGVVGLYPRGHQYEALASQEPFYDLAYNVLSTI